MMPSKRYTHFHFNGEFVAGYDAFNHIASLGMDILWRRKTADFVRNQMLQKRITEPAVLDLASGTGDMALILYKKLQRAKIIGIDPSADMLIQGKIKKDRHNAAIHLVRAVRRLPFLDQQFNAVTCAFGMRNFMHLSDDLQEMYRLLKPGGSIYVLDFFVPQNKFNEYLLRWYNAFVFPLLGFILTGHIRPYRYLFVSIFNFKSESDFVLLLNQMGFHHVKSHRFFCGLANLIVGSKHIDGESYTL